MDNPQSQSQPETSGQRLLGKMPPSNPLDETWLAPWTDIKCACTVGEIRRVMITVKGLSAFLQGKI